MIQMFYFFLKYQFGNLKIYYLNIKMKLNCHFCGNWQKEKTQINLRMYIKEHIKLWKICVIVKDIKTLL